MPIDSINPKIKDTIPVAIDDIRRSRIKDVTERANFIIVNTRMIKNR